MNLDFLIGKRVLATNAHINTYELPEHIEYDEDAEVVGTIVFVEIEDYYFEEKNETISIFVIVNSDDVFYRVSLDNIYKA